MLRASLWGGEAEDASLPALSLLRALHALSRHWHTLYRAACLPDHRPLVPNSEFINAKVTLTPFRFLYYIMCLKYLCIVMYNIVDIPFAACRQS